VSGKLTGLLGLGRRLIAAAHLLLRLVLRLVLVLVLHVLRLVKRHACGVVRRVRDQARRGDGVEIAAA
jgi:hypothetical protein